jgi:hypothetical protein
MGLLGSFEQVQLLVDHAPNIAEFEICPFFPEWIHNTIQVQCKANLMEHSDVTWVASCYGFLYCLECVMTGVVGLC